MSKNIQLFVACLLILLFVVPFQAATAQEAQPSIEAPAAPVISSGQPVTNAALQPLGGKWFNANLIQDGDAENASYASFWQDNEGFSQEITYEAYCGASCAFPGPYDPGPTLRGNSFFYMGYTTNHGPQTNAWIKNKIPVSLIQSTINTGLVRYIVSGYFGGYASQGDTAQLHLFFENGSGSSLAQVIVGNVTPAQRNYKTGLVYRQMTGYVPKGTANINMVLQSGTLSGSDYRTGFADNLSLVLLPVQNFLPAIKQPTNQTPPRTGYPAPSAVVVAPNGLTRMQVNWTDNTNDELGFEVQRINADHTVDTICNTRPDVTECLDPGISASVPSGYIYLGSQVTYTYQVRAIGPSVNSAWANGAGITATMPTVVPSLLPSHTFNCQSLDTTSSSTTFVWNDPFNYEAGFALYANNSSSPNWLMLEGGTKISFINQPPGTITLTIKPFVYDPANPNYVYESSTSCTAQAVLPSPSSNGTSRFTNNASYPVISLIVDGWEQFPVKPLAILPGTYYELTGMSSGSHSWTATTGFWDNYGQRFEMYTYSGAYNQPASGTANITLPDMTIQNLLTVPPTNVGYWEGYYWDANIVCHTAAFKFYPNGSYAFFVGNVQQGTGTYSLVQREPSIFSVKFHVSGLPTGTDALLIETNGMFYLKNGPTSWLQITYVYKPQGYVYNAFCP